MFWPTPNQDNFDQEHRALAAGRDRREAVVAVDTEAAPDSSEGGSSSGGSSSEMAAPTTTPQVEEDAREAVVTLGAAEPPARGAGTRGDTATPRPATTETTGSTRTEAPTELAALVPQTIAERAPTSLS